MFHKKAGSHLGHTWDPRWDWQDPTLYFYLGMQTSPLASCNSIAEHRTAQMVDELVSKDRKCVIKVMKKKTEQYERMTWKDN